jgi:hypothetical protein
MLNPFTVCSLCQCQFVVWVLLTRKRTEVIRLERTKRTCPSKELICRVSITRPLELSLSYYCFGKSWRALAIRPAHVLSSWRSCQWKWNVTARTADPSATLLKKCNRVLFMYYSGLPYVLKIIRSTSWSSLQRRSQTVRKYEPTPTPATYRQDITERLQVRMAAWCFLGGRGGALLIIKKDNRIRPNDSELTGRFRLRHISEKEKLNWSLFK